MDSDQQIPSTVERRPALAVALGGLLAILSLGLLYCWFWGVTMALVFGPAPRFWMFLACVAVSVAAMVAAARRLARARFPDGGRAAWLAAIAIGWTMAAAATWYALGSPLGRGWPILAGFAATTWWLLWAWLMFFVPWRPAQRIGLLLLLAAVAGVLFGSVRANAFDGDALPLVTWRFAPVEDEFSPGESQGEALDAGQLDETDADHAADYPRFRGADGLGRASGANLARDWSARPPKLRWQRAVGAGWSAFAVDGKRIFTQEQRGEDECVVCYARATGRQLWVHRNRAHYQMPSTGDGPRATPTVDGPRVFTLGATGILNALDRQTGRPLWTVDILKDAAAQAPGHGMTGSPLVVGEVVVVCAGGARDASLVAYDNATGRRAWGAGSDPAGYTSPQLVTLAGLPQIVIITTQHLIAHDPQNGRILWQVALENDQKTNCSQPFPVGADRLFASTNYGTGCLLLEAKRDAAGTWQPRTLWSNRTMQTKFASAVVYDGHAYGLDDGILECVSLEDGRRLWKRGRYGHGQLLLAGDLLVIQAEDGRVVLVEANPRSPLELGTISALEGRTWNYPALAGAELFIRNDRQAACYELPLEASNK